ncbi:MAG: hypothetical protein Q4B67_06810, partial [Eubacteriales bacterium]|nr:hypothetical protein [Eubacteriales bacterium]
MKRIFNLVLITLMTVSMLTGESVSRLKATSSTTSIFKVDSDVTEPGWESALSDGDDEYVKRCHAGDSVTKDPTLKNIFKYDTYAFMMVETDYCDGIPFAEIDSVNDGWTEVTDISPGFLNDSYVRIFKYDSVLTPNERTGPLFESVTVLDTCSAGDYEINISGILIDSAVDEDEAVKIAKGNLLYYPPIKDRQEAISAYKTNFYANVTEAMAFNGDQSLYPRIYYTFDGDNTSVINITIPSFLYPLQNGQLFRCWSYTTQIIDIYNREFMFDLYPGDYLGTITGPVENKRYNAIYAYTSYFVGNTVRGYKTDRITNMFRIEELPLLMMLFTATPSVYMAKPSESSEQEIMAPEQ